MPVIQATMWAGITEDNKKKLVEGTTEACEAIGILPKPLPSSHSKFQRRIEQPEDNFTQKGFLDPKLRL